MCVWKIVLLPSVCWFGSVWFECAGDFWGLRFVTMAFVILVACCASEIWRAPHHTPPNAKDFRCFGIDCSRRRCGAKKGCEFVHWNQCRHTIISLLCCIVLFRVLGFFPFVFCAPLFASNVGIATHRRGLILFLFTTPPPPAHQTLSICIDFRRVN